MEGQRGILDLVHRYRPLSRGGDPLQVLNNLVPWEDFRSVLEGAVPRTGPIGSGGAHVDSVLMCKVLVLGRIYNLADEPMEYLIRDRLSFMRFLGLGLSDKGPDGKTICRYREHWTAVGVIEEVFERFDAILCARRLLGRDPGITFRPAAGTVLLCNYPDEPPKREMKGRHHVIVVSPKWVNQWNTCVVVPVSTRPPEFPKDYHVRFEPGAYPFFPADKPCWAKCDMVGVVSMLRLDRLTVDGRWQDSRNTKISTDDLKRVKIALARALE